MTARRGEAAHRSDPAGESHVRVAVRARDLVGEGPFWDAERRELLRVDIRGERILRWSADDGAETPLDAGGPVSVAVPDGSGGLVVAGGSTVMRWRPDGTRAEICEVDAGTAATTLNDGKCDALGRLWIGTWDREGGARATLQVVDLDGSVRLAVSGLSASNGLAWNADFSAMYLVDTPRRVIWRYEYSVEDGQLGARAAFVRIDEGAGLPDGMATDRDGGVWVALFSGGAVHRYDAEGALTHVVPVPVTYPTSLAFGGPDLATLFVTTSSAHPAPGGAGSEPLAGSVLAFPPGTTGVPVQIYRGEG
jgi:sugar lactone lactonase YvrE